MLEGELIGEIVDAAGALFAIEADGAAQLGQDRAGLGGPGHGVEPAAGATEREIVPDQPEAKVVGQHVRARDDYQDSRTDEEETVEDQPEAVLLEVALELRAQPDDGGDPVEIGGVDQAGRRLLAEMPQEALLRHAFGNPAEDPAAQPAAPAAVVASVRRVVAMPLGFLEERRKTVAESTEEARLLGAALLADGVVLGVDDLAVQLMLIRADRNEEDLHAQTYDSTRTAVLRRSARIPAMCGALILGLAFASAAAQRPQPDTAITVQVYVFNGPVEVTTQTRLAVHQAGDRSQPVVRTDGGASPVEMALFPGLYDVQATHLEGRRVLNIQWALRLVVMPYPDEHGRHLEVINLQNGYGALEIQAESDRLPPVDLHQLGDRRTPLPVAVTTPDYLLYVLPGGAYDLRTGTGTREVWRVGLDIPIGRTRLYIVPSPDRPQLAAARIGPR